MPRPEFRQEVPNQLLITTPRGDPVAMCPVRSLIRVRHSALGCCGSLTDRMRPATNLFVALLVALAAHGCARAQAPQPAPAPQVPMRHVLPNGVRVIIQEFRSTEVVAVQLWVRAGSRDETAAELGLAHYLEHMLFKGTTTRARGFTDREVEGVGGRINAGTAL